MGLTEFHHSEMRGGSGTGVRDQPHPFTFATTGAPSLGDLAEIWGPWPVAFLGGGLLLGVATPSGQSLCTPLTHHVAFIRWFACSFPFSATPSRYLVTRDWVGAVGCTCDVSHGFTPQDYSRRMHKMGSGPEGWPGRIDYRRSSNGDFSSHSRPHRFAPQGRVEPVEHRLGQ